MIDRMVKHLFPKAESGSRIALPPSIRLTAITCPFRDLPNRCKVDIVIAAGAWSTKIQGGLIDSLPLETERGYHVMFPSDASLLTRPVGLADAGLYISPLADGLRAAGTVELAGLSAPPNQRRLEYIRRVVKKALPASGHSGSTWLGFRPTLPSDSLPVIGRSADIHRSLRLRASHRIGITLGGDHRQTVQQLADDQQPECPLDPYRPERFLKFFNRSNAAPKRYIWLARLNYRSSFTNSLPNGPDQRIGPHITDGLFRCGASLIRKCLRPCCLSAQLRRGTQKRLNHRGASTERSLAGMSQDGSLSS